MSDGQSHPILRTGCGGNPPVWISLPAPISTLSRETPQPFSVRWLAARKLVQQEA